MIRNQALNLLFLKTGLVAAFVAACVALYGQADWAASFASAALIGLINWYLLAVVLIDWTSGRGDRAIGLFCIKLFILMAYVVIALPLTGLRLFPFLLGFNMLLVIAVLEALGSLIADQQSSVRGQRPLPQNLKALLTGRPNA